MVSRNLADIHPELRPLAQEFLNKCREADLDILVTCTYRSVSEQEILYAKGRTMPGKIVTMAKGGQSDHNFTLNGKPASRAFDIVPLVNGKAIWDTSHPAWRTIETIWRSGIKNPSFWLDWYGKPDAPFHEFAHFCLKKNSHK